VRRAAVAVLLWMSPIAGPQSFEVASVKIHPDPPHIIGISTAGARITVQASFIRSLVAYAYDLKDYQIAWAPGLKYDFDTMYDITAKAEGDTVPTKAQFKQMMQSLLAERFKLKVHREQREMQVYALIIGNSGPKFKESAPGEEGFGNFGVKGRNQIMTLKKATMEDVVQALGVYVPGGRPIIDRTGLTGTYAVKFEATPDFRMRNPEPDDVSVFTAVQEQLGLKLETQKAMIEVVVIDHVEKPSEN